MGSTLGRSEQRSRGRWAGGGAGPDPWWGGARLTAHPERAAGGPSEIARGGGGARALIATTAGSRREPAFKAREGEVRGPWFDRPEPGNGDQGRRARRLLSLWRRWHAGKGWRRRPPPGGWRPEAAGGRALAGQDAFERERPGRGTQTAGGFFRRRGGGSKGPKGAKRRREGGPPGAGKKGRREGATAGRAESASRAAPQQTAKQKRRTLHGGRGPCFGRDFPHALGCVSDGAPGNGPPERLSPFPHQ